MRAPRFPAPTCKPANSPGPRLPTPNTNRPQPVVPTCALTSTAIITAYTAAPAAIRVTFTGRTDTYGEAPTVWPWSSRGPSLTDNGITLVPDILAPGVGVFAATVIAMTRNATGEEWEGTSMAAPHVGGIAALIRSKHPR